MTEPQSPGRRPLSDGRYRALIAVALVAAAVALVLGVRATNTDGEDNVTISSRPDMVEHVYPPNGDQVLRQSEIGVDLGPGYEGDLIVNGQPIPEEELRRVPEQNQVFYLPGKGTTFEELPGGTNCVTATAWRSATGRGVDDQTFSWCFEAS